MEPLKDLLIFEQTKEMKSLKMKTFQFCIVWRRRRASLSFKSYLHARSEYQTAFDCHKHSIISIIKAFIPLARHKKLHIVFFRSCFIFFYDRNELMTKIMIRLINFHINSRSQQTEICCSTFHVAAGKLTIGKQRLGFFIARH